MIEKPYIKNLCDGIDIEFSHDKLFGDQRPKRIIVYKNTYSNCPADEFLIKETMKKFGFSISYGQFDNKDVTYECKILCALSSKKQKK
jgi:hypothetical protein